MANSKMTAQHLHLLREQLLAVQSEIRSLQGKEAGLKAAIAIVGDEPQPLEATQASKSRRSPIKDTVLRLALERAADGVVAAEIVEIAKTQGLTLDRNSVSSLLSKFKRDGVLDYDGKVYRPKRPFPREVKSAA